MFKDVGDPEFYTSALAFGTNSNCDSGGAQPDQPQARAGLALTVFWHWPIINPYRRGAAPPKKEKRALLKHDGHDGWHKQVKAQPSSANASGCCPPNT